VARRHLDRNGLIRNSNNRLGNDGRANRANDSGNINRSATSYINRASGACTYGFNARGASVTRSRKGNIRNDGGHQVALNANVL